MLQRPLRERDLLPYDVRSVQFVQHRNLLAYQRRELRQRKGVQRRELPDRLLDHRTVLDERHPERDEQLPSVQAIRVDDGMVQQRWSIFRLWNLQRYRYVREHAAWSVQRRCGDVLAGRGRGRLRQPVGPNKVGVSRRHHIGIRGELWRLR